VIERGPPASDADLRPASLSSQNNTFVGSLPRFQRKDQDRRQHWFLVTPRSKSSDRTEPTSTWAKIMTALPCVPTSGARGAWRTLRLRPAQLSSPRRPLLGGDCLIEDFANYVRRWTRVAFDQEHQRRPGVDEPPRCMFKNGIERMHSDFVVLVVRNALRLSLRACG
jgi:hypothetical protein